MRVHPEILKRQKLPPRLVGKRIWDERLATSRISRTTLARQGTKILKFFLHVSRKEQKKRFLDRLDEPEKNWKFSASDVEERKYWNDYMEAFEEAIRATASKHAPWFVVPADNKWFTRLVVAAAIVEAMASLDLAYPKMDAEKKEELAAARVALSASANLGVSPCTRPLSRTTLPRPSDTLRSPRIARQKTIIHELVQTGQETDCAISMLHALQTCLHAFEQHHEMISKRCSTDDRRTVNRSGLSNVLGVPSFSWNDWEEHPSLFLA